MMDGGERRRRSGSITVDLFICLSILVWCAPPVFAKASSAQSEEASSGNFWQSLIVQAKAANLPVQFLLAIAPEFVAFEFDDLHAFAAEYHPEDHRLILNRSLSFNAAGGTLKPLKHLAPREIGTLYHELFHAYMDYISSLGDPKTAGPAAARMLAFARNRQECFYQQVNITPIMQRRTRTEIRFLTERESWEALNETWAVFVGWAIWTKLDVQRSTGGKVKGESVQHAWLKRLRKADQDGDLVGYYEPENKAERAIARKRYLAPSHRITPEEVKRLLQDVLEYSPEEADRSAAVMHQGRIPLPGAPRCRDVS